MSDDVTDDVGDDPMGLLSEATARAFRARFREPEDGDLSPRQLEMRRLAASTRTIIDRLAATGASTEAITEAADRLAEVAASFTELRQGAGYEGFAEMANAGADPYGLYEQSPFIGGANPLAPPIRLREVDGEVHGRVTFGAAYEGPPGCLHGGYVAGAFDEVLGAAQSLSGAPGMTGTLTVVYRSPTPLHTELHFRGALDRVEGRKIFTKGWLHAGEQLCAEAEGIFISLVPGRFAELMADRDEHERARAAED